MEQFRDYDLGHPDLSRGRSEAVLRTPGNRVSGLRPCSRVMQRVSLSHLLHLATVGADDVARPVHVAAVRHGDDEPAAGTEGDHRCAVASAALTPDVVHDSKRWDQPGKGPQERIGEHPVHPTHEPWEVHRVVA